MQLVDRTPWRHVVRDRADHEDGHVDAAQQHRLAVDRVTALAQVVVEKKAPQVLAVHARGQAGGIRIPGHQVAHGGTVAHQVLAHHARPQQVVRAQHLEGAGHLAGTQVTGFGHLRFEQADLRLVDEESELAGLGEIRLRGQERHGREPMVAVAGHGRRGNGEQRPAQAIAAGVNAPAGDDGADGLQRGNEAELQIVVHVEVAVGLPRVLPGNAEDGVAPVDQVADQRVVRREVQDVVLHDPGRDDEDRLGPDARRGGRVLDQFDQAVAQDDLARRDGDIAANHEVPGAGRGRIAQDTFQIFQCVEGAAYEVGTALIERAAQHHRIAQELVARREGIEQLARGERHHVFVVPVHAPHAMRCRIPPLLGQQKGLVPYVERPHAPFLCAETAIMCRRQHAAACLQGVGRQAVVQVAGELGRLVQRQLHQLQALAGGQRQVPRPVQQCKQQRHTRQRERGARDRGVQRNIDLLDGCGRRSGFGRHRGHRGVPRCVMPCIQ